MGDPKFPRKRYTTPLHPWKEDRIKSERELLKKYGLKNHKEVWKAKTGLGKYRHQARGLLGKMGAKDPQVKKESEQLLVHLTRIGVLPAGSSLDDVLALEIESVLSRRLQTLVYLKGLSTTPDHSRQLIIHGHIAVDNKKVTIPSYIVIKDEENKIGYTGKSPLNEMSHPARPKTDIYKTEKTVIAEEKTEKVKETIEPKKESDKKGEKNKETEDIKDKTVDSAEKPKEKTETNKDLKDVPPKEKPSDDKEPTTPVEKQVEQPKGKEEDVVKESKEKTVVTKETAEQMKQPENDKQEKPVKEEKSEPSEKKETKKPNENKGGK